MEKTDNTNVDEVEDDSKNPLEHPLEVIILTKDLEKSTLNHPIKLGNFRRVIHLTRTNMNLLI